MSFELAEAALGDPFRGFIMPWKSGGKRAAVQTLREVRPRMANAQRLDCGGFSTALGGDHFSTRHRSSGRYLPVMKLFRLLAASVLVGFTACRGFAQAPAAAVNPVVSTNKTTKHCLWEVKGKTNTVFLLGSMHVMKDDMYPLAPEIEAAYQQASVLVFETDMKALESPALAFKLSAKAMYPEDDSLKEHVSPAIYSLLISNLQSSFLTEEMVNRFRPWMAAMTVVLVELQKQGFDVQNGLDKHFAGRAETDGKTVDFFEQPEFQIALLTSLGDKESEEFLGQALRDMDVVRKQFKELVTAWQTGDTKALDKLLLESFREYPLMHRKFLLDRNRTWIPKLEKLLNGGKDVLVVVGAGHLVGKESVVDLLTAKGYKIEQR